MRPSLPRRAALVAAELVLTAGVLVLLYAGYLLVWTNLEAGRATSDARERLERGWAAVPAAPAPLVGVAASTQGTQGTAATAPAPSPGEPFALLRIPRLGADWSRPVVEGAGGGPGGIGTDELTAGVAHYPGTPLPGEVGNAALAGHRTTHGQPFHALDRLRAGDRVLLRTATEALDFRVSSSAVVTPDDSGVLLPVPYEPGAEAGPRLLTLTTCHPRYGSTHRLVVHAELRGRTPVAD